MRITTLTSLIVVTITLAASTATSFCYGDSEKDLTQKPRYVHLDPNGKKIGLEPLKARCVLDLNTGLVWEIKTSDSSVHNRDLEYRWGGTGAEKNGIGFFDDWNSLLQETNSEKWCGFKDWRVPNIDELKSLVDPNQPGLTINTQYFFDTKDSPYWSSTTYANYPEHAQTVHFGNGNSYYYNGYRGNRLPVRLVRGKQKNP